MGWFDDDDSDDDEEEVKKRPSLLMNLGDDDDDDGVAAVSGGNTKRNEDDDEIDPLDAFMSSIHKEKKKQDEEAPKKMKRDERLDVENEDEATSHWVETNNNNTPDNDNEESSQEQQAASTMNAKASLDSMFHKASNQDAHRQVNIQLEQVHYANGDSSSSSSIIKQLLNPRSNNNGNDNSAHHQWRKSNSISCYPPMEPIYDFRELEGILPQQILDWNIRNNITQPTLVQSQTLGVALTGIDAIVTASTGSGKTLAYLYPLVAHLIENHQHQQQSIEKARALVLVPTRELALQVESVAKSLLKQIPTLTPLAITGGNLGRYQLSQTLIKTKPHIVLATPGRLLDVLSAQQKSKQNWLLPNITFLVLDEADKMLQLGFAAQVTQILQNLRPDRQSILTSATLSNKLEQLCTTKWMKSPVRISIGRTGQSSSHIQQHVLCLPNKQAKRTFLQESLPTFVEVGRTIVFVATRQECEELAQFLSTSASQSSSSHNIQLQTLHGDKHPSDRNAALKAFTKGKVNLLIATDVAGRGLDIPEVATVINYDPAKNWDTHVHRIGRAGRLSAASQQQEGNAYTLLTPSNIDFAKTMVSAYERENRDIPNELRQLSQSYHNNQSRHQRPSNKRNKSGLGFTSASPSQGSAASSSSNNYYGPSSSTYSADDTGRSGASGSNNDYYGSSSPKKSRWGS